MEIEKKNNFGEMKSSKTTTTWYSNKIVLSNQCNLQIFSHNLKYLGEISINCPEFASLQSLLNNQNSWMQDPR